MRFRCRKCDQEHDLEDGIGFGIDHPAQWDVVSDAERAQSELYQEQCILRSREGVSRYLRGRVLIPIRGTRGAHLIWGVWCSLSEKSWGETCAHWEDPERVNLGPYFGWLSTQVPGYPKTMFLKTHVRPCAIGVRPLVELERTDHPLAVDQRDGVDLDRLRTLVEPLLHPKD